MLTVALAVLTVGVDAHAFEGEWRAAVGGGAAVDTNDPARGLIFGGLAYGVSDGFDVRGELLGALGGSGYGRVGGAAGVLLKFDVTQWVPYVGLSAGVAHRVDSARWQWLMLPAVGVDYLFSRELSFVTEYRPAFVGGERSTGVAELWLEHQLLLGLEMRWGW
jgi:hypothetical protein